VYDKRYIIPGIIILLILLPSPLIYNYATKAKPEDIIPKLEKPLGKKCVKDKEWMLVNHMDLLERWRELNVRYGIAIEKTENGVFNTTLEECFKCHTSADKFCTKCHEYMGVEPLCWQCHSTPELVKEKSGK